MTVEFIACEICGSEDYCEDPERCEQALQARAEEDARIAAEEAEADKGRWVTFHVSRSTAETIEKALADNMVVATSIRIGVNGANDRHPLAVHVWVPDTEEAAK